VRRSTASSAAVAVREVLRNPAIRRIEIAWTAGTAADWAFLVVLLVVSYDEGGTLAVGILGAVRVLPAIVAAPFATSLVGRFRGDRVLTAINVLRCAGAVATAAVVALELPVEVTYVLAGVVAGAGSLVRPIQNALLPALARTPGELIASNVASSVGEGLGTFAGPLLAGALVASTGSVEASVIVAAVFAFIFVWTEFFFALNLTSRNAFTLPTIFRAFLGFQGAQYGEASALAVTSLVPSIILGMLVQRHLVRGLTLGAVQG